MTKQLPEQIKLPESKKKRKTTSYQNVTAIKMLANALSGITGKTQPEILEITGLCNSTISRWLRFLNTSTKESKALVYISGWKRTGERGNYSALWSWGFNCLNAPKPKAKTQAEYHKRWRDRKIFSKNVTIKQTEQGTIYAKT